jgi:hypothetical protein
MARTRFFSVNRLLRYGLLAGLLACVDPDTPELRATVDVIVVDGTLNDLPEPQLVYLNRSRADPKTGRFGSLPLTGLRVEVVVDSVQPVVFQEIAPGTYQSPAGFRGQVGHRYHLRFALENGARYESTPETMQAAPPIEALSARFNPRSLPPSVYDGFTAAHDVTLTTTDPADRPNYYRWDWVLYEKQDWCRSCYQGVYAVYNILPHQYHLDEENRINFVSGNQLFEDCFAPLTRFDDFIEVLGGANPKIRLGDFTYDYPCRTRCWEIIRSSGLVLFDDQYTNGGRLTLPQPVARIPYFTRRPALVEIRQTALSREAYAFYKLVLDQTQNNGGLTDTPPVAPIGNVRNPANPRERVVGFFAAGGVSTRRLWLDRKDATGSSMGVYNADDPSTLTDQDELFVALNKRRVSPEPPPPYMKNRFPPAILIFGGPPRVPTAVCVPSLTRTPVQPEGWQP